MDTPALGQQLCVCSQGWLREGARCLGWSQLRVHMSRFKLFRINARALDAASEDIMSVQHSQLRLLLCGHGNWRYDKIIQAAPAVLAPSPAGRH